MCWVLIQASDRNCFQQNDFVVMRYFLRFHNVLLIVSGFGGQTFQERSLEKLRELQSWAKKNKRRMNIIIDGGVNNNTAALVLEAGANILVAGSYLFQFNNLEEGSRVLLTAMQ